MSWSQNRDYDFKRFHSILVIGADILDSTNQNTFTFGRLKEEPTWFELDRIQRNHFEAVQTFNEYLRLAKLNLELL